MSCPYNHAPCPVPCALRSELCAKRRDEGRTSTPLSVTRDEHQFSISNSCCMLHALCPALKEGTRVALRLLSVTRDEHQFSISNSCPMLHALCPEPCALCPVLLVYFSYKLFHFTHSTLVNEVSVVRFAGGGFIVDGC